MSRLGWSFLAAHPVEELIIIIVTSIRLTISIVMIQFVYTWKHILYGQALLGEVFAAPCEEAGYHRYDSYTIDYY